MGAFGQSVGNSVLHAMLLKAGPLCRGQPCCCAAGRGHKHPAFQEWERAKREDEAAEAGGEGWPSASEPA